MDKRIFFVRFALVALLFGVLISGVRTTTTSAQVSDDEAATSYLELIALTDWSSPILGPESTELPYEAGGDCPECTWAAGLSITDVRVHVDIDWQGSEGTRASLIIGVRQQDPQAIHIVDPNFVMITPTTWLAGGENGFLVTPPTYVDVIAIGDQGYLGIDGELITTFSMTGFTDMGDVVITAVNWDNSPSGTLGLAELSVWEIDVAAPPDSGLDQAADAASTFDDLKMLALLQPAVYGPASGSMAHDPTAVTFFDTGVSVSDFVARIECEAPNATPTMLWDCGIAFRDVFGGSHYRLGVVSDGSWFLSIGSNDPTQSGEGIPLFQQAPGRIILELAVQGATGYFGVDGVFVSSLDLSAVAGPGTVAGATSFFDSTYVADGQTVYEDFSVVTLDDVAPQGLPGDASAPAGDGVTSGNSYTDPDFGYSLNWNETWSVFDSGEGAESRSFMLTNGSVIAEIYGVVLSGDATACVQDLYDFYATEPGFSNFAFATDAFGADIIRQFGNGISALMSHTVTDEEGVSVDYFDYVLCVPLSGGQSMVRLEQYVPLEAFPFQLVAMDELIAGLEVLPLESNVAQPPNPSDSIPSGQGGEDVAPVDGAEVFYGLLANAARSPIVFGPAAGDLVHDPEIVTYFDADVSVTNFAVTVDCLAPRPVLVGHWDCGLEFRDVASGNFYRLEIVSDGTWDFNTGGDESLQSGSGLVLPATAGGRVTIDLIVMGVDAYFAVDGAYVATLDVSGIPGPGSVAVSTSFYTSTYVEGGSTAFENFTVRSLDNLLDIKSG